MKRFFFMLLISLLLLSGCSKTPDANSLSLADSEYTFNAVIKHIGESIVLVEVCEDEDVIYSSEKITFSYDGLDAIMAEAGDIVTITYTGTGVIAESYPAQITALSWSIFEKHNPAASKNPNARFTVDDLEEDFIPVEYSYEDVFMSAKLPSWWEYETIPYGSEDMKREFDNGFGLHFWDESAPELSFKLLYRKSPVGLCGTGLTVDKIILQNGETASAAVYGDSISLVWFSESGGHYTVSAYIFEDKDPWQIYYDEIISIIKTVELGGNLQNTESAA